MRLVIEAGSDAAKTNIAQEPGMSGQESRQIGSGQKGDGRSEHQHFQFSSVQLLSRVRLFVIPWTTVHQTSLSITNFRSMLELMSIELVMPSNHLILCCPLLLLPSIVPSIRVFSNESALCIILHCKGRRSPLSS